MARTLPPRHWQFSRRRRIPPGPASRSGPWTDLFHAVAAWHHIPLNGHLRRQRRKVGVSMAETSCKRCMSIATRRAQNSVLVDKRVHRPWYQGLSDGQAAASGRTDRSAPQFPPSLIAPSATLTPPGIRSPSTAIAGGITPPQGRGTESPLARPRVLVVRGDSLGIGCTDRISVDAVVPVTFRAAHPCRFRACSTINVRAR